MIEKQKMPAFNYVKEHYKSSYIKILDRHNTLIHEQRVDFSIRRKDWVSLKDIPRAFIQAIIVAEDKRFYSHSGVDYLSLAKGMLSSIVSDKKRGASTITMQVVSMLDIDSKHTKGRRSILQKIKQIKNALTIERLWTKDEIMEAYVNLVSFKGEIVGIQAAATELFRKVPSGLNSMDSAILASLIRDPNAKPKNLAKRACIIDRLYYGLDRCLAIEKTVQHLTMPFYSTPERFEAPHVAYNLINEQMPTNGVINTTIDGKLQLFVRQTLRQQLLILNVRNVHDGAVLVVDNKSGEILAYVGNTWEGSKARFVDGVRAKRSAGSTLKPFVYALSFDKRVLTAASLLLDAPLNVPTLSGTYRPSNYDESFKGLVTVRTALASSLNIPAVRALSLMGPDAFIEKLEALGFNGLRDGNYYGLSLALGSVEVSLYELVNAYRALANGGVYSELKLRQVQKNIVDRVVFSKEAAFIISTILSDRQARSATFDLENPLSTAFWSAVKTGTSKNMRDNWCVGYSANYTVGVWVGNFDGAPMQSVSGISGAAPVWLDVMEYLHKRTKSTPPIKPTGASEQTVVFREIGETRKEWFINGTEADSITVDMNVKEDKIIYPAYDSVIAMDPDIPSSLQRIFFERKSSNKTLHWSVDDVMLGTSEIIPWTPLPGKHVLKLIDSEGTVVDRVLFFVRN